ncbi:hypothetical protein [Gimesia aquarii]|uniref:Uncharacterized protein n=1 Tax=Gimesia aquarii TaxID=2527964 RepID=A0A517WZF7_9PLAN|nr:hypothetical protein [Gimesia aquarii]QDU10637.1 hypothetical protein V202x_40490 [Gimesia aquarii]
MSVKWNLFLAIISILFPVTILSAAEIPESAISSDASIVIRLKDPKATSQKVASLINQVDENLSGVVGLNLRTILGRSISNPNLAGVDTTRDMCVGVFLSQSKQPGFLYAVPVANKNAFKEALGEKYHSATHENWLLYSSDQALVDQAMALIKDGQQNFQTHMSPRSRDLFAKGDLSLYINSGKLVQIYQPQLEQAGQKVDVTLNRLSETVNTAPGVNMKPIMSIYSAVAKGALQAVQDSKSYTTALNLGSDGLGLESLFEVRENSQTDQLFQKNPPRKFEELGKFPANQLAYFAGAGNTEALITWGMNFTAQMFDGSKPNAEAKTKFEEIVKEIHKLKFGSYYFSFELGKLSDGVLNAYAISEVEPSQKMRDYTREMMSLMQNISIPGLKQQITFSPDEQKIGDEAVDLTVIKQEVDPESDPLQIQKRMLEVLYGSEGITNRMAYPKGKVLQVMGANASMQKFLDALNASDASKQISQNQPTFKHARTEGLSKANILAMFDLPMGIAQGYNIFAESRQKEGPFTEELMKQQGISPSYLTFSLSTGKQSLETKTYIPVQNLKSGFKIFMLISTQR